MVWVVLLLTLFWLLARPKNVPRWIVLLSLLYCLAINNYLQRIFLKDFVSAFQMIAQYLLLIIPVIAATYFFARSQIFKMLCSLMIAFVILIPFSQYPSSAKERTARFKNHFSHTADAEPASGSCDISNEQFVGLSISEKTSALEACRVVRNPCYIPSAIALVDHPNEKLALNAALYLEAVTGEQFGADRDRWEDYQQSKSSRLNTSLHAALDNPNSELVDKGFSAEMIVDAFQTGQEAGKDFLTLYIQMRRGSAVTKADLMLLRERARPGNPQCSGESNCFRLGMNYFLLALAETLSIAQGNTEDATAVQRHWEQSINILEQTRELGAPIALATQKILKSADTNGDHQLSNSELANLIRRRL